MSQTEQGEKGDGSLSVLSRDQLFEQLGTFVDGPGLASGLRALTKYVGASHYLLARYDLLQDGGVDFVVSSDWPFDLVRGLAGHILNNYGRRTEVEKCLHLLQPTYDHLPDDVVLPEGLSHQYCSLIFSVGRMRLSLMLLYRDGFILSPERLREIGLLSGYCASLHGYADERSERDFELTEREIECLSWIAEGKTSDEIAVILGISKNTINNYITSVMRKTATKTRSEAIAFAVRNHLV